ncbi:MAG: L,D-transpeptidase [Pyrinomonadaceae bacterium]|nr:L,D-transpeptidase [Pyrinomonadaceae bacterium]
MKDLTPIATCLLMVLVINLACHQRTVGKEPQAPRSPSKEADKPVPEKENLKLPLKDPRIVVFKSKRQLELYSNGAVVRTYRVGLGLNPVDDKQREGDRATPEGEFYIFTKNPKSSYYLSLGISYPNLEDAERGLRTGLITRTQHDQIVSAIKRKAGPPQYTALGGLIYIHGNGASSDWTWGCVALENEDIKELYHSVDIGTPVTIEP